MEVLAAVAVAVALLLQLGPVQSFVAGKALDILTRDTQGKISFSSLDINPTGGVVIKDLLVLDPEPLEGRSDTVAYIKKLSCTSDLRNLTDTSDIHFGRITIRGGILNLVIEPDSLCPNNLARVFGLRRPPVEMTAPDVLIESRRVIFEDFTFSLFNTLDSTRSGTGINWHDFTLKANAKGHNMAYDKGVVYVDIERSNITADTGYEFKSLSGWVAAGMGLVEIADLHVTDGISNVRSPRFRMHYKDNYSFYDFIREVSLDCEFGRSTLAFSTLGNLAGIFPDSPVTLDIEKLAGYGPVDNLRIDECLFKDTFSGMAGSITGSLGGFEDGEEPFVDLSIDSLSFDTGSLSKFISGIAVGETPDLSVYADGERMHYSGSVYGKADSLQIDGKISCLDGGIIPSILIRTDVSNAITLSGGLDLEHVDLGRALGKEILGPVTLGSDFYVRLGEAGDTIRLNRLDVSSIFFNGTAFEGLRARMELNGSQLFIHSIECRDPKLDFEMTGLAALPQKGRNLSSAKLQAELRNVSLSAFAQRNGDLPSIGSDMTLDISEKNGRLSNLLILNGLTVTTGSSVNRIGRVTVRHESEGGLSKAKLHSRVADINYNEEIRDGMKYSLADALVPVIEFDNGRVDSLRLSATIRNDGDQTSAEIISEPVNVTVGQTSIGVSKGRITYSSDRINTDEFLISAAGNTFRLKGSTFGPFGQMTAILNAGTDSLILGNENFGTLRAKAEWNDRTGRAGLICSLSNNGLNTIDGNINITPSDKSLSARIDVNRMPASLFSSLLEGTVTDLDGILNASNLKISKNSSDLLINCDNISIEDLTLRPVVTDVLYHIDGKVHADSRGLHLGDFAIRDEFGGKAEINGDIHYSDNGKSMSFDIHALPEKLKVLNITDSESVYGDISTSGSIRIHGVPDNLSADASLNIPEASELHIPLTASHQENTSSLLSFVKEVEQAEQKEEKTVGKSRFDAKVRLEVDENLEMLLEIDKATGNGVTAKGSGVISAELGTDKPLDLDGSYNISGGQYTFELPGVLRKDFNILNTSSIKFNGDLMDSELDINTSYSLKTSLAALIADSTVVTSRRLVECLLDISGNPSNPTLNFDINVPDLEPGIKAEVDAALNSDDKKQRQFIALLFMGTFMPTEQAGIFNNTNILYSNVGSIMSSQLNNIMESLNIPLDLGLGYQTNETGTDIFDVAVSTQLFNNRVLVNGSVGNRQYSTTTNPNGDMVGDLDIEVKLDRNGKLRLNLFSHSADEISNYLDYSQRNGIGLTYHKEFSHIRKKKGEDGIEKPDTVITIEEND